MNPHVELECFLNCYLNHFTAILALYLRNILGFSEDIATVLYHTFSMLCYFTPILGAIIADNYIGKFRFELTKVS